MVDVSNTGYVRPGGVVTKVESRLPVVITLSAVVQRAAGMVAHPPRVALPHIIGLFMATAPHDFCRVMTSDTTLTTTPTSDSGEQSCTHKKPRTHTHTNAPKKHNSRQ